jgi:hypothetical protein
MPRDQSKAPKVRKPTVVFDTSTLNRLAEEDNPEPLIAEILARFDVRLSEMSIGEIYATRNPVKREKLNDVCRRFLNAGGQCLHPAHWIIGFLMRQFHKDPIAFDWRGVQARFHETERVIDEGTILGDEELVSEQRSADRELQDEFEKTFGERRARFDHLVANGEAIRPKTFQEWFDPSRHDGGHYWTFARGLYEVVTKLFSVTVKEKSTINPTELTLRIFANCGPFYQAWRSAFVRLAAPSTFVMRFRL